MVLGAADDEYEFCTGHGVEGKAMIEKDREGLPVKHKEAFHNVTISN